VSEDTGPAGELARSPAPQPRHLWCCAQTV